MEHTIEPHPAAHHVSLGRWDLSHLWQFELVDDVFVAPEDPDWQSGHSASVLAADSKLSRLVAGEQFVYQFDLGDGWLHLCQVGETRVDPLELLGDAPPEPTPYDRPSLPKASMFL